jgi:hypothetical protein
MILARKRTPARDYRPVPEGGLAAPVSRSGGAGCTPLGWPSRPSASPTVPDWFPVPNCHFFPIIFKGHTLGKRAGTGRMAQEYRAYEVGRDGRIVRRIDLICEDETDARLKARQLLKELPVELWEGRRLLDRLEPR